MNEHVALKPSKAGYDTDFYQWSMQQAELLRAGRFDLVDIENIAEEIESLGNSDKRPRSDWRVSATYQRQNLDQILGDSPSLNARRAEFLPTAWKMGVNLARKGMKDEPDSLGLLALVAASPIYSVDQILNDDFFPGD
jgi:hypothetical protein